MAGDMSDSTGLATRTLFRNGVVQGDHRRTRTPRWPSKVTGSPG